MMLAPSPRRLQWVGGPSGLIGTVWYAGSSIVLRALAVCLVGLIDVGAARAVVLPPPVSVTASSEFAIPQFAIGNLFDATVTDADVGATLYGNPDGQWAGVGVGPFNVFMDFGSTLTGVDGLAYSQRLGGTPSLDKVGRIDLWFSNTDFGGAIPGTAADASVNITNLATTVLTQYSFGGSEFAGQYVAAQFFAPPGGGGNIGGSEFRFTTDTPLALLPELTIDRSTGAMTLMNNTSAPINFIAYQINSDSAGALDASSWTSIAQNYDAGSPGPNQVDPTEDWIEFTPAPFIGTLAEGALPGGDGATLGVGASIDLGTAWIRNPTEDIEILLQQDDGTYLTTEVTYEGGEIVLGDFNFNGQVDPADWPLFRMGLGSLGTGLTPAQTYGLGDLDGDGDVDIADFRAFEAIYDAANGQGALAGLISSTVPEPTSLAMLLCGGMALALVRCKRQLTDKSQATIRHSVLLIAGATAFHFMGGQSATAQTFTLTSPATPTGVTANSEFSPAFGVGNLFDDATITGADIGVKTYTPMTTTDYAGVGVGPMEVFMDFGGSISANYISFAHRLGGDPLADKVGQIDLWFSNTNFNGTLPATAPNVTVDVTDLQLEGVSKLSPYSLGGAFGGQFVAARLTISDVSAAQPVNNLGGGELRLVTGPSDVVLEVNRSDGSLTIRNQGSLAQSLEINGYEISSAGGSLLASWDGFQDGSVSGFPGGSGSGNGWEKGNSSNANLLAEAYLLGTSTLDINDVLSLGTGYDNSVNAQDLKFSFSIKNGNGLLFTGAVSYIGTAPGGLLGDYNGDGTVDAADYTVWRDNLGGISLPNEDPTTSPGTVDAADYAVWQSNFGASSGSGTLARASQVVPEPATWALFTVFATIATVTRRRVMIRKKIATGVNFVVAGLMLWSLPMGVIAGTPDAIYLFGDNSSLGAENGAPGVEVGQAAGADIPGFTIDHQGDPTFGVLSTYRDLAPNPDAAGQRPAYVNTAVLNFPGTNLGATSTGIGIGFDGVDDHLRGPGLGFPQDGDANFTGEFEDAYQTIVNRMIDGWVRPTNLGSGQRQDIVNDTYQFGIHITENDTWGINFGSTAGVVDRFAFDSGVDVAGTLDSSGWAHINHRTIGAGSGALYVNGELVLLTAVGQPFYHGAAAGAAGADLEIVFGANLAGNDDFFTGQFDNFRLIIAGDNTGLVPNGQNYGDIDLGVDNDYIAANVVRGDANGDGVVNGDGTGPESSDDVTFFVNHFLDQQSFTDLSGVDRVIGDITSITTMADFDGSGTTDIRDWFILRQAHVDTTAIAAVDLGKLLAARYAVPEPGTAVLILLAVVGWAASSQRVANPLGWKPTRAARN